MTLNSEESRLEANSFFTLVIYFILGAILSSKGQLTSVIRHLLPRLLRHWEEREGKKVGDERGYVLSTSIGQTLGGW